MKDFPVKSTLVVADVEKCDEVIGDYEPIKEEDKDKKLVDSENVFMQIDTIDPNDEDTVYDRNYLLVEKDQCVSMKVSTDEASLEEVSIADIEKFNKAADSLATEFEFRL